MSARKFAAQSARRRSTGSLKDLRDMGRGAEEDERFSSGLRPSSYFGGSTSSALSERCDSCNDLKRSCSCELCLWEFDPDAPLPLSEEKAKMQSLVMTTRKQEEDVIEQLVQCHLEIDALHEAAMRDACRIRQLTDENNRLQEQLIDSLASSIMGDRSQINGVTNRLIQQIQSLEKQLEACQMREAGLREKEKHSVQNERWKILEIRREKILARRELDRVTQHLGEERARTQRLRERVRKSRHTRRLAEAEVKHLRELLSGGNSSSDTAAEHLSQELKLLRLESSRQKEALKDTDLLRDQLEEMRSEIAGLRVRVMRLSNAEQQSEHWRKRSLTLEVENRRLKKMIDQLRRNNVRKARYHYVTSF